MNIAQPAVRKGNNVTITEPKPFFPSELLDQQRASTMS